MAVSQNGWSVISSTQLNRSAFPGTSVVPVPGVRAGDVATVLHYVGTQFNNRVEALVNPGCWGYANRTISGSSDISNHASGTAIDLNAPRHPLGKRGTFSSAQVARIREILRECDGVIRWGGDYSSRADEMHFEIVGNATQVANTARKLTNQGGNMVADRAYLDRVYQKVLERNRGAGEGENVYLGKDAGWVFLDVSNSAEAGRVAAAQAAKDQAIKDLQVALANEQAKPPREVVKEIEKIVEKPVEVIKEIRVGETDAIKGFFARLIDKLIIWNK